MRLPATTGRCEPLSMSQRSLLAGLPASRSPVCQARRFCLIRGMTHPHPRHGWGLYYMLTGKRHSRPDLDAPPTPDDFPGLGALASKLGARRKRTAPIAVTLPRWNRFLDVPNDYAGEKEWTNI